MNDSKREKKRNFICDPYGLSANEIIKFTELQNIRFVVRTNIDERYWEQEKIIDLFFNFIFDVTQRNLLHSLLKLLLFISIVSNIFLLLIS